MVLATDGAVRAFLPIAPPRILYTCSVQEELDHQTALHALDLAHRWQVDVVVAILIDLLAGMMTDESFASIGEHAVLKGLEKLKAAAQRFGAESKKVQADLKAGRLPFAAQCSRFAEDHDIRLIFNFFGLHLAQMARIDLFWIFLEDFYPVEALKKLNLEGFDWSSRHANGHTILVHHICNTLVKPADRFEDGLKTLDWLICSGASMEQTCAGVIRDCYWVEKPEAEVKHVRVECNGHSAISYARTVQEKMRENLKDWKDEEAFLAKVLQCFAQHSTDSSPNAIGPRVSIHEGIAELWEKSLAAKDSHDLTMETADGRVTAHSHMLKAASSVVAAMLESPMKEGKTQRIEIKDTSSKAVSLFLEILYTCSAQYEPDYETALHALDLAHRWQVEVVVAILTDLLAGMITDASFGAIAEHALLKGLERLKTAAKRFGTESSRVQADLKNGCLPAARFSRLFKKHNGKNLLGVVGPSIKVGISSKVGFMSAQMGQAEQAFLFFAFLEDFHPLEDLKKMNLERIRLELPG
eukprot:s2633_g7.t1